MQSWACTTTAWLADNKVSFEDMDFDIPSPVKQVGPHMQFTATNIMYICIHLMLNSCSLHALSVCESINLQCLSGGKGVFRVDLGIILSTFDILCEKVAFIVLNQGLKHSVFAVTAQNPPLCQRYLHCIWCSR
jgi:hypothetical protein